MIENGIPDCSISAIGYILEMEYGQSLEEEYYFGHQFYSKEEFGVVHLSGTPFGNPKLNGQFLDDPLIKHIIGSTRMGLDEELVTSTDDFLNWLHETLKQKSRCFLPFVHSAISSRDDSRDIYHTLVVESYDDSKNVYLCTDQTGDCWVTKADLRVGLEYIRKEFGSIRKLRVYQRDDIEVAPSENLHNIETSSRQSQNDFIKPIVHFLEFLTQSDSGEKIYAPRIWTFKQQRKSELLYLAEKDSYLHDTLLDSLKALEKAWVILDMKILKHNMSPNPSTYTSVIDSINKISKLEEGYYSICEHHYLNS